MKIHLLVLFLILSNHSYGQALHHQMLASQGGTITLKNGIVVRQTIGQQSSSGNASLNKFIIQQGFQQSLNKSIFSISEDPIITTTVYPNPFVSILNIQFSEATTSDLTVSLFNLFGVLITKEVKSFPQSQLLFNFENIPSGSYVLQLTAENFTYSKTLIKI